jgi:hypothetical protein
MRFQLYSDSTCQTAVASGDSGLLNVDNTGAASFFTGVPIPSPGSSGTAAYYWKVTFSGNEFNTGPVVLDCKETTTITHNDNLP